MLIMRAFAAQRKEHLSIRQNCLNYLSGLAAHERGTQIVKSSFLVQILSMMFRYFNKKEYSDQKVFDLCFVQSVALIFAHMAEDIERESPELFASLAKTIFETQRKALPFVYGTVLRSLADLTKSRLSLKKFNEIVLKAQKQQEEKTLLHHKQLFDRISKNFPFQAPYYIYPEIEYELPPPPKR